MKVSRILIVGNLMILGTAFSCASAHHKDDPVGFQMGDASAPEGGGGGPETLPPVTCAFGADLSASGVCSDLACVECQRTLHCAPFAFRTTFDNVDACIESKKVECSKRLAAPQAKTPLSSRAGCAKDMASLGCDDFLTRNLPESCKPVPGDVPDGASCGDDAQCRTGYCHKRWPGARVGACGTCRQQEVGAPCSDPDGYDCGPGMTCQASKCGPYLRLGAACSGTGCAPTLKCIGGRCSLPHGKGESCADGNSNACDQRNGLNCAPTGTCEPALIGDLGPCDALHACGPKTICVTDIGPGQCQLRSAAGSGCGSHLTAVGQGCLPPAVCSESRMCIVFDPASCSTSCPLPCISVPDAGSAGDP